MRTSLVHAVAAAALVTSLPAGAAGPAAEILDLVPPDATAVVLLRWSELRASSLYRDCESRLLADQDHLRVDSFARHTGVDPARDLDSVVFAVSPAQGERDPGVLGIAAGRFDESRIVATLGASGARFEPSGAGSGIWRLAPRGESGSVALAFLPPALALFGSEPAVRRALLEAQGRRHEEAAGSPLRELLSRSVHAGQVWGAVTLDRLLSRLPAESRAGSSLDALRTLEWVTFDADLGRDVRLVLEAQARGAEDAERLKQVAEGALSLLRAGAREDLDLATLLAETSLQTQGARLRLRTRFSPEGLDEMLARPRRAPRSGAR